MTIQQQIDETNELISYCEEGDIQLEELYCKLDELHCQQEAGE